MQLAKANERFIYDDFTQSILPTSMDPMTRRQYSAEYSKRYTISRSLNRIKFNEAIRTPEDVFYAADTFKEKVHTKIVTRLSSSKLAADDVYGADKSKIRAFVCDVLDHAEQFNDDLFPCALGYSIVNNSIDDFKLLSSLVQQPSTRLKILQGGSFVQTQLDENSVQAAIQAAYIKYQPGTQSTLSFQESTKKYLYTSYTDMLTLTFLKNAALCSNVKQIEPTYDDDQPYLIPVIFSQKFFGKRLIGDDLPESETEVKYYSIIYDSPSQLLAAWLIVPFSAPPAVLVKYRSTVNPLTATPIKGKLMENDEECDVIPVNTYECYATSKFTWFGGYEYDPKEGPNTLNESYFTIPQEVQKQSFTFTTQSQQASPQTLLSAEINGKQLTQAEAVAHISKFAATLNQTTTIDIKSFNPTYIAQHQVGYLCLHAEYDASLFDEAHPFEPILPVKFDEQVSLLDVSTSTSQYLFVIMPLIPLATVRHNLDCNSADAVRTSAFTNFITISDVETTPPAMFTYPLAILHTLYKNGLLTDSTGMFSDPLHLYVLNAFKKSAISIPTFPATDTEVLLMQDRFNLFVDAVHATSLREYADKFTSLVYSSLRTGMRETQYISTEVAVDVGKIQLICPMLGHLRVETTMYKAAYLSLSSPKYKSIMYAVTKMLANLFFVKKDQLATYLQQYYDLYKVLFNLSNNHVTLRKLDWFMLSEYNILEIENITTVNSNDLSSFSSSNELLTHTNLHLPYLNQVCLDTYKLVDGKCVEIQQDTDSPVATSGLDTPALSLMHSERSVSLMYGAKAAGILKFMGHEELWRMVQADDVQFWLEFNRLIRPLGFAYDNPTNRYFHRMDFDEVVLVRSDKFDLSSCKLLSTQTNTEVAWHDVPAEYADLLNREVINDLRDYPNLFIYRVVYKESNLKFLTKATHASQRSSTNVNWMARRAIKAKHRLISDQLQDLVTDATQVNMSSLLVSKADFMNISCVSVTGTDTSTGPE